MRFDEERLEKLRFQKMIPEYIYWSVQDFFDECDDSNRATGLTEQIFTLHETNSLILFCSGVWLRSHDST